MENNCDMRKRLDGTIFGYYSNEEILKESVQEIYNPLAFDQLSRPLKGGLYDQALGVSPYDQFSRCVTCGQESMNCAGHLGHIQLVLPVYNPFLMDLILKLLRSMCLNCHHFRIQDIKIEQFEVMLKLIRLGYLTEKQEYESLFENKYFKLHMINQCKKQKNQKSHQPSDFDTEAHSAYTGATTATELLQQQNQNQNLDHNQECEEETCENDEYFEKGNKKKKQINQKEKAIKKEEKISAKQQELNFLKKREEDEVAGGMKIYRNILKLLNISSQESRKRKIDNNMTVTQTQMLKDTISSFWTNTVAGKCPHCNKRTDAIMKEGYTKIFIMIKSNQQNTDMNKSKQNLLRKMSCESFMSRGGGESDGQNQNDDLGGNAKNVKKKQQRYMTVVEVKTHIQLLWQNEKSILQMIFGNILINQDDNSNINNESVINGAIKNKDLKHKTANKDYKNKRNQGYEHLVNSTDMLFFEIIPVTPNRFRPENKMADQTFLHAHTVILTKILQINADIKRMLIQKSSQPPQTVSNQNLNSKQQTQAQAQVQTQPQQSSGALTDIIAQMHLQQQTSTFLTQIVDKWIELQDTTNCLMDSSKAQGLNKISEADGAGIKQILEKKEGLFRMKMMGKRVNYACRSVISPDPQLDTSEVGLPVFMAMKLTFPEGVHANNVHFLSQLVINGAHIHPGANFLEEKVTSFGHTQTVRISLDNRTLQQRKALAQQLSQNSHNKTVYRHVLNGDPVLFNRQPTLHKCSMLAHLVRVLKKEQTIRMHYANCASYNADFDGDEMNVHVLQGYQARSEAKGICLNDLQYTVPKDGKPIRGLIQDSVVSSVLLSYKDTFLTKQMFQQLLFGAMQSRKPHERQFKVVLEKPAIMKPQVLYTGKQLITGIIKQVIQFNREAILPFQKHASTKKQQQTTSIIGLNMTSRSKLTQQVLGHTEDATVLVRDNELLTGIIDKNQIGNSEYGLIHCFYEIYGPHLTGALLSCLSRLNTSYLQMHGFTCSLEDLFLTQEANKKRSQLLQLAHVKCVEEQAQMFLKQEMTKFDSGLAYHKFDLYNRPEYKFSSQKIQQNNESEKKSKNTDKITHIKKEYVSKTKSLVENVNYLGSSFAMLNALETKLVENNDLSIQLDNVVRHSLSQSTSEIMKIAQTGLLTPFPNNCFKCMVMTGAKGSAVNHNQVSLMLGQQELEGRRVPIMSSGRSLPSFLPYDPNPRAGGFVGDRFLNSLRLQEFYFHCMAGREGLIDTAVKTSRSGYLQRCLVKHLESLKIQYDYTVRDADNSIVQFLYGEDALDPSKKQFISKFDFTNDNKEAYVQKYKPATLSEAFADKTAFKRFIKRRRKVIKEFNENYTHDKSISFQFAQDYQTALQVFSPGCQLGAVSENMIMNVAKFIKAQKQDKQASFQSGIFKTISNLKYFFALGQPGDAVGPTAAQSIGEPSTQMTLNTFHLAGHGGANVTLGIPRLREILMTGSQNIKTPSMTLKFVDKKISLKQAQMYQRKLQKVAMLELVKEVKIAESKVFGGVQQVKQGEQGFQKYEISVSFEDMKAIDFAFSLNEKTIQNKVKRVVVPAILANIFKQLKQNQNQIQSFRTVQAQQRALSENAAGQGDAHVDQDDDGPDDGEININDLLLVEDDIIGDEDQVQTKLERQLFFNDPLLSNKNDSFTQNPMQSEELEGDLLLNNNNDNENAKLQRKESFDLKGRLNVAHRAFFENLAFVNSPSSKEQFQFILTLRLPLDSKKVLMLNVVELCLQNTVVNEIRNIKKSHLLTNDSSELVIQTEGVNYKAVFQCPFIDPGSIYTNDIHLIFMHYGIEATYAAIIQEIKSVFGAYHIEVDHRHLSLVSDYMTFTGEIRAMNRTGMAISSSQFLQMSFETTMQFLTQACVQREIDTNISPSSQIVLGRVPTVGTGMFDVRHQIKLKRK